jgi:hypothetical protein
MHDAAPLAAAARGRNLERTTRQRRFGLVLTGGLADDGANNKTNNIIQGAP